MNGFLKRRTMLLTLVLVALMCAAGMALAGDAIDPPEKGSLTMPATVYPPPSAEVRYANVQRAMAENSIGFRADVMIGDDGRLMVRVVPVDLLAK